MNENYGKCETTKTDSNFPPSLQSSWENEFVVKIKRKRKKQSSSLEASPPSSSYSSSGGIKMMRNINSFKDENIDRHESVRKSFLCGHRRQPNATTMSKHFYKNIFSLFLILLIFNTQITFQRPLHNSNVEQGSLTSAMVRI